MKVKLTEQQFRRVILEQNREEIEWLHGDKKEPDPSLSEWNKCSADVKNATGPILVVFSASWCGPCKKLKSEVFATEEFKSWVVENDVTLLDIGCVAINPMVCKDKCSDGKTYNEDGSVMKEKFGGKVTSGLIMPGEENDPRWTGIPRLYLTDSSMNKKILLKNLYQVGPFIKQLDSALTSL